MRHVRPLLPSVLTASAFTLSNVGARAAVGGITTGNSVLIVDAITTGAAMTVGVISTTRLLDRRWSRGLSAGAETILIVFAGSFMYVPGTDPSLNPVGAMPWWIAVLASGFSAWFFNGAFMALHACALARPIAVVAIPPRPGSAGL